MKLEVPLISFTFDDFPRSALLYGGGILQEFKVHGSYYASLGLINGDSPSGILFQKRDLDDVYEQGHELGCHTFGHCHASETEPSVFEASVRENGAALERMFQGKSFRTMAYPVDAPKPATKRRMRQYFEGCRGGGQTINVGCADTGYLAAFFLEKTQGQLDRVKEIIEANAKANGWLIFATHDVCERPSAYGVTPQFFRQVVVDSVRSGARIVTVAAALRVLERASA